MRLRLATELPESVVRAVVVSGAGAPVLAREPVHLDTVEALEKHLARKLGTDPAATACTQVTRLPGFVNHKRATPYRRKHRVSRQRPGVRAGGFSKAAAAHDACTDARGTNGQSKRGRSSAAVHRRHSAGHLWTAWRRPHVPRLLSRCQGVRVGGRRGTRRAARVEQPLRAALVRP